MGFFQVVRFDEVYIYTLRGRVGVGWGAMSLPDWSYSGLCRFTCSL